MGEERLTSFRSKSRSEKLQDRKAKAEQQRMEALRVQNKEAQTNASEVTAKEKEQAAAVLNEPSAMPKPKEEVVPDTLKATEILPAEPPAEEVKVFKEETKAVEMDKTTSQTEEPGTEEKKAEEQKPGNTGSAKTSKPKSTEPSKKDAPHKKMGRKKVIEEERKTVYIKCGDEAYAMIRKAANWSRTTKNDYMCSLVENEMKLYEKNPENYISSRAKKVEEMEKKEKTGNKAISFKAGYHIIDFLNDITYDVDGTRDSYLRTIVAMDYEKKLKERNK